MPGVILQPKFLFDDMTHQRTGPDPSFKPISHRPAIQNVAQPLAILAAEGRRPPAAVPFQQAFFAVPVPLIDPQRNGAAMHLEMVSDLTRGVPIQAHQDPLNAQHHPRLFIALGLLSEFQQFGDGCLFALSKGWAHIVIITHFTINVELFRRVYIARTVLMRRGATTTGEGILVTFPNGETRRMAPGPSSVISKAVIEEFAKRYLINPAVLWVSESGAKVVARDDELAAHLKLKIAAHRNLPDIIPGDLGDGKEGVVLLVFIEVVASDGPVTPQRQEALLKIATDAGFPAKRVVFVTAYLDRSHPAFKKTISELAWRSFAWFAAEPEHLIVLQDGREETTRTL